MKRLVKRTIALVCVAVMVLAAVPASAGNTMYDPPIVQVKNGQLRGIMDGDTYNFRGVRYAVAERFGMPQPVEPWEGVVDAQVYGPVCPIAKMTAVGSDELVWPHRYWVEDENCQYLNIWTQNLDTAAKKPVMVFMHGGAFSNGSSIESYAYDGRNLSEFGDVVMVTLNHRVNVIGCLNLSAYGEEYANSGNTGMADLVAALEWIQENIEYFGGDPDNVLIFGQSGGSGKVVTLMHMPEAEGLFHKVIAESSGTASVLLPDESRRITERTMEILGIDETQLNVLKEISFEELLTAADQAVSDVGKQVREESGRSIGWRPLQDDAYIMTEYCDFAYDIPFIAGTNFSERSSTLVLGDGRKNEWTEEETLANLTERYGDNAEGIIEEFTRLFPDKITADAYFYAPSYRNNVRSALSDKLAATRAPVYNYLFSYEAPVNGGITPFHCAELIYVFHNVGLREMLIATGGTPESFAMQDVVAQAWVNFAYTGDPSQEGLAWTPYTLENEYTMVFDKDSYCVVLDDQQMVDMM